MTVALLSIYDPFSHDGADGRYEVALSGAYYTTIHLAMGTMDCRYITSTTRSKKPAIETFLIALLLLGLATGLWLTKVETDRTFILGFARDIYFKYMPNANLFAELLSQGELPLWNPYLNCGTPLLALDYFGPLYPFNIMRRFLDPSTAFVIANILHTFLLTAGMYIFCRKSYMSALAALLSASALIFSGAINPFLVYHPFMFHTASLLPWGFLCARSAATKGDRVTWAILFSLVLALQVLAGTPEIALTTAYFGCGYIVVRGLLDAIRIKKATPFVAAAFLAGTICAAALLACSVQLLPQAELVRLSYRPTVTLDQIRFNALFLPTDLTAYLQGLFSTPHVQVHTYGMYVFYLGILTPLLALIALSNSDPRRRVETRFLFIAGLVCGFMCMMRYPVVHYLIYVLGLGRVRWSNWVFPGYGFAMAYLAGVGFDRVFSQTKVQPKRAVIGYGIPAVAVIVGAYLYGNPQGQRLLLIYLGIMMLALAGRVVGSAPRSKLVTKQKVLVSVFLVVVLPVVAILVNLSDVSRLFSSCRHPRWASRDKFDGIPKEFTKFLEKESTNYSRSFICRRNEKKWVAPSMYGELKILGVDDDTPLGLARHATLLDTMTGKKGVVPVTFDGMLTALCSTEKGLRLLKLFSTEFYACEPGDVCESLKRVGIYPVFESEGITICRDTAHLPRAYFVRSGNAHIFNQPDAALQHILSDSFDPFGDVAIELVPGRQKEPTWRPEEPTAGQVPMTIPGKTARGGASISTSDPRKVQITARAPEPGYLILTDTYYPGWRAYVDGVDTPIYQANYLFRAVPLNAGDHEVRFVYRPRTFAVGAALSLAILSALILTALFRLYAMHPRAPT